jgi:hypothetical protein
MDMLSGSGPELEERLTGFEKHLQQQKIKLRQEKDRFDDLESQLKQARSNASSLLTEIGQLRAEEKVSYLYVYRRILLNPDTGARNPAGRARDTHSWDQCQAGYQRV